MTHHLTPSPLKVSVLVSGVEGVQNGLFPGQLDFSNQVENTYLQQAEAAVAEGQAYLQE